MPPGPTDPPPEAPTSPGRLSPEARDELVYEVLQWLVAKVQWLVERELARGSERGYLRGLLEAPLVWPPRLDQIAALVVLAALAAGLGVSGPDVLALVFGSGPGP